MLECAQAIVRGQQQLVQGCSAFALFARIVLGARMLAL